MRLLTRGDFDGLCCAALLKEIGVMDDIRFVHPKDIQDGIVAVGAEDVLVNVPYVEGVGMWFDHHVSEAVRLKREHIKVSRCRGAAAKAPSTARVIWRYYGGLRKFPKRFEPMMEAVDKMDSGQLAPEEIQNPEGWVLLGLIVDPRTGLGRHGFTRPTLEVLAELIDHLRTRDVEDILALPDMQERVERYHEQDALFREMLGRNTVVRGSVAVTDLRAEVTIYAGNRFLIYTMFPQCHSSVFLIWDPLKENVVCSVGHSIINRECRVNVGMLLLEYGGGGHSRVGTCQLYTPTANQVVESIVERLNQCA